MRTMSCWRSSEVAGKLVMSHVARVRGQRRSKWRGEAEHFRSGPDAGPMHEIDYVFSPGFSS
jgi:hypothetical protein